ncbi:UPF0280 family protein [Manganibacter manganicus]|uniref:Thiamine biosynthesis protein ApbE n=1 Tax=Manganibacter manganicus TaxID=1873176 RepID=A0A1V8RKM5_9HYPH|nr:UPF0280 family protein [Pseudaminobacter manganicus]OQM73750.1 thiamine biosynthesis protein ApbE [Pseudaminobacter manganicus]
MTGPQAHWLEDGKRLHLNHGPIDLIVQAFGAPQERQAAYQQAVDRFRTVLDELVAELPKLRYPASVVRRSFTGPTARRMEVAVAALASNAFITPMAAVAGAVADEILAAMVAERKLERAYVNNGGDTAFFLASDQAMRFAIAGTGHGLSDRIAVHAADPVRGVATSGWRGRSFSLGIADAVTVLAHTGAAADAAATLIANAIDLPGHPAVARRPARDLAPDSDLGGRLVTTGVSVLSPVEVAAALERGLRVAENFRLCGLIQAAAMFLCGNVRLCGRVLNETPALTHMPSRISKPTLERTSHA